MTTAAEFARHRPHAEEARVDERYVRVLFVEDRTDLAEEIRSSLGRAQRGSFEIVRENDFVTAAARVDSFDLLLVDLSLGDVDRSAAIELANELAHRLPVVVLAGTEGLAEPGRASDRELKSCVEHADIPGKLLQAMRRARRLGTGCFTPIFCRIEGLCA